MHSESKTIDDTPPMLFIQALNCIYSPEDDAMKELNNMISKCQKEKKEALGLTSKKVVDKPKKLSLTKAPSPVSSKSMSPDDNSPQEPPAKKPSIEKPEKVSKQNSGTTKAKSESVTLSVQDSEDDSQNELSRAAKQSSETPKTKREIIILSSQESEDDSQTDLAIIESPVCHICGTDKTNAQGSLVECQDCHKMYHQKCHTPPVSNSDATNVRLIWYCSDCKQMSSTVTTSSKDQTSKKDARSSKKSSQKSSSIERKSTRANAASTSNAAASVANPFRRDPDKNPLVVSPTRTGSDYIHKSQLKGLASLAQKFTKQSSKND